MRKTIFLVDMNAFFISCEMARKPELTDKPAAVAGDPKKRAGIILAANYEARSFGVKTAMTIYQALKLCPNMILVSSDHSFYEQKSQEVMNLLYSYTPMIEQNSIDEAWLDMTGTEMLFGTPAQAAERIMDDIKNKLGLWCSIGISENKFLSKMASNIKKPLGITELWKEDVPKKLWQLPVNAMYGIGPKTAQVLNGMGIRTIGEFARYDKNLVIKKLGKSGEELYMHANGIDIEPLVHYCSDDMKSIGRSVTLPKDLSDIEKAKLVLMKLSDEVSYTARKHNKKGSTVQITLKYSDFSTITRQTTVDETYLAKEIYGAGEDLLCKNWKSNRHIRLLGISISGFDNETGIHQLSMFDISEGDTSDRGEKIERTIDSIRDKYGYDKVGWAALMKGKFKKSEN
jgi:DNA polymerase-4